MNAMHSSFEKSNTCVIFSKSTNIPNDVEIWSKIKAYKICELYNLDNLAKKLNFGTVTKQGNGIFFKMQQKIYVVTCFHIIGLINMEIYTFHNNKKIPLVKLGDIPEFDITILCVEKQYHNDIDCNELECKKINEMEDIISQLKYMPSLFSVNVSNTQCTISSTISNTTQMTDNCNFSVDVDSIHIIHDYVKGNMLPKVPLIEFKFEDHTISDERLRGLSGSSLLINNEVMGMIFGCFSTNNKNETKIQAISMIFLQLIIESFIRNTNCISGVNQTLKPMGYYLPTRSAKIREDGQNNTGVCIVEDIDISYKTNTKKAFKFRNGDVIYKINDVNLNDNCTIYSKELGCNIKIDTHIMIKLFFDDYCKLNLFRKINDEYKKVSFNVSGKALDNLYDFKILNDYNYIYFRGFVFTELSEELILNLNKLNLLNGQFYDQKKIIKKSNMNHVIMIDTDNKITLVEKIGNKKITNLDDIHYIISQDRNITCSCKYENEEITYKFL